MVVAKKSRRSNRKNKRSSHKRSSHKRSSHKRSSHKRSSQSSTNKRSTNKRSTHRRSRQRGGDDCPPGWLETSGTMNAFINEHSGNPNKFVGGIAFVHKGNNYQVTVYPKTGLGGYCIEEINSGEFERYCDDENRIQATFIPVPAHMSPSHLVR